jgi:hypothetical protein
MTRLLILLLLALPAWGAYGYKRTLTIDYTKAGTATLTDFPVLFSGTYSWLATVANGGRVESASGYDIAFYSDEALSTQLKHEVVSWDAATGAVEMWVKVPSVSHTANTIIYIAYGDASVSTTQADPTNVWDSSYKGVWHLPNGTTLAAEDSTVNNKDGSITGAVAASGKVDGAASFAGSTSTNRISVSALTASAAKTWEAWLYVDSVDSTSRRWFQHGELKDQVLMDTTNTFYYQVENSGGGLAAWKTGLPSTGQWVHVVVAHDGSSTANDPVIYFDGVSQSVTEVAAPASAISTGSATLLIGNRLSDNARAMAGDIDEMRMSNAVRSSSYVTASYNSQNDPSTFYAVGDEVENSGGGEPEPSTGLSNSVTIHEASGSGQTARPMSLMRFFAQGEFATGTYPKPRIGGTVPDAWQVDVKTSWPDGSIQQAIVSFRLDLSANGSAVVDFVASSDPCHLGNLATCEAAALTQQQMLDFDTGGGTGSWSATWYGTVNSVEYSASARTMLDAGAWRWWLRGPVVSGVIIEDRSTALTYDFGWQYSGGAWGAPSEDKYKSLHPVFEARFYPSYAGVEIDAQISNASMHRFQQITGLTLTLKTGASEATTAYTVSDKTFHARSRRHKLVWSGTAPGAIVTDYNFRYLIHTRVIPSYDYRLPVASTLADSDLSSYASRLGSDEAQWCETSTSHCASWQKGVGGTGARGDIALIPRWYLEYLYLMGHGTATVAKKKDVWDRLVIGNADAAGNAPVHYMMTTTGTFYPAAGEDSTLGRVVSLDETRGWWPLYGSSEEGLVTPATHVCASSPCDGRINATSSTYKNNWTAEGLTDYTTHAPSFYAIPYLLTGYHYYLVGAQMEGAFGMATTTTGVNESGTITTRMHGRGIIYQPYAPRAIAWTQRNIWLAALVSPDSTVERAYFQNRLQNNAEFFEGAMLVFDGAHAPVDPTCASWTRPTSTSTALTADMWCAGRDTMGLINSGVIPETNPAFVPYHASPQTSNDGFVDGHRRTPSYMMSYVANVWAWIAESGTFEGPDDLPLFHHVSNSMAAHYAGRVLSSVNSMMQFRIIDIGVGPGDKLRCETFDECASSAIVSWPLDADMNDSQTTIDVVAGLDWKDGGDSYFNIAWAKIDDEYVRLTGSPALSTPSSGKARFTISARGVWGSTAAAHTAGATVTMLPGFMVGWASDPVGGYPVVTGAALNLMAARTQVGTYSPKRARDQFMGALPYQNAKVGNPQWATAPYEVIRSVTATGGAGAASLSWIAPPATVCKVYIGATAPASSSDAPDSAADATKARYQTFSATGLNTGTNHYRITCGTARVAGTVTVGTPANPWDAAFSSDFGIGSN